MDGNGYFIINYLLMQNDYVTYTEIAKELTVSQRTVLRYIKNIPSDISGIPILFQTKRGIGIKLNLNQEQKKQLLLTLKSEKCSYWSKEDRVLLILFELFSSNEYVKSYYLASYLNVSAGTIERDLKEVSKWLGKNGLKLYISKGKGICISGKESNIRQGLMNFYFQFIDTTKLSYQTDFTKKDFLSQNLKNEIQEKYYGLLDLYAMQIVKDIINLWIHKYHQEIVEEDYIKIIIYFVIMLQRNERDIFMEAHQKEYIQKQPSFKIYWKAADMISKDFGISFSEDSVYYFVSLMISKRSVSLPISENNTDLYPIVEEFLSNLEKELHLNFGYDSELIYRLQMHLELMIERVNMDIFIHNSYLKRIKENYSDIFETVKKNIGPIASLCRKKMNDDEIGYIVIHILATVMEAERESQIINVVLICMNGFGTSRILSEIIKQKFSKIQIVKNMSSDRINELEFIQNKVDFIISTVPVETAGIPAVVVNPFLSKQDEEKIQKYMDSFVHRNKIQDQLMEQNVKKEKDAAFLLKVVNEILRNFSFHDVNAETKEDFIHEICKYLDENIRQEVEEKIRIREQRSSSVIDEKGFLLLHCRMRKTILVKGFHVKKSFEDTCNGNYVNITSALLMIAPEEENLDILDLFGLISSDLVLQPDFMELIEKKDELKIMQHLSDLLLNYVDRWR